MPTRSYAQEMAHRRSNKKQREEEFESSDDPSVSPRKSQKETPTTSEVAPPALARNVGRGVGRKMTFGTGSQLKNPKGLSIDVDEADVDEHNTTAGSNSTALNRSQTSTGMMKQPARSNPLQLSARGGARPGVSSSTAGTSA